MKEKILLLSVLLFSISLWAEKKPSEVLSLDSWKITMPYSAENAKKPKPMEVSQPELNTFSCPRCFYVNKGANGVIFRAHCSSISTKTSKYPRSELREMNVMKDGVKPRKASWGTNDGKVHTLIINQAITSLPSVKPHLVSAQIHDAKDDLIMVRLEGRKLFVERNKVGNVILNPNYVLGTRFDLKIVASENHVKVYYNDELKMDWEVAAKGCYFKTGCYTQSNESKGDKPDSYGEVIIYKLVVEHK